MEIHRYVFEKEIYIHQTKSFVIKGSENKVYKLNKALYELKGILEFMFIYYSKVFRMSDNEATLYSSF